MSSPIKLRDLKSLSSLPRDSMQSISASMPPVTMHTSSHRDLEPDPTWSTLRLALFRHLKAPAFEVGLSCVILVNVVLVILETDAVAAQGTPPKWMEISNYTLLSIYSVELAVSIYVYRGSFLKSLWNIMDLFIVGMDLIMLLVGFLVGDMPSFSILRIVRLARLTRSYKVLIMFPELYLMIRGLGGALKVIFWGCVLSALVLTFWGILAVHLIHPINQSLAETGYYDDCERCPRAFSTVMQSNLTFMQQVIAGDAWGELTIPIIEHRPITVVFFLAVFLSKSMLILNLILGMILDAAQEARKGSDKEQAAEAEKLRIKAHRRLLNLCAELDVEQTGMLSLDSLLQGYDSNVEFSACLQAMGIQKDDIEPVYGILDEDNRGHVSYTDFANQVHKMKTSSSQTLLVFIKHYVMQIRAKLAEQLETVERQLFDTISSKTVTVELPYKRDMLCDSSSAKMGMLEASRNPEKEAGWTRSGQRSEEAILEVLKNEFLLLRQVKDELVASMRDLSLKSETNSRVCASLNDSLPLLVSTKASKADPVLVSAWRERQDAQKMTSKKEQLEAAPEEAQQRLSAYPTARAWPLKLCSPEIGNDRQETVVSTSEPTSAKMAVENSERVVVSAVALATPQFEQTGGKAGAFGPPLKAQSYGPLAVTPTEACASRVAGRPCYDILRIPRPLLDRQAKVSMSLHAKDTCAAEKPVRWVAE